MRKHKIPFSTKSSTYVFDTGFLGSLSYFENNLFYLLWGKDDELEHYLPELFKALILDVLESNSQLIDTINFALFDDVEYSFYRSIKDLKDEHNISSTLLTFGILDTVYSPRGTYYQCLANAIARLFNKSGVRQAFLNIFIRYAETQFSYKYFDNHIERFLLPELINNLFSVFTPNEKSLGLRVHLLIKTDNEKVLWTSSSSPKDSEQLELVKSLVRATSRYITELQEIDKQCYQIGFSIF